ncbi:hypothetical protein [Streptomyces fuscichromogenes]|nr:hypothetical protein [Streptomyces fuscichromogenes]
MTDDDIRPARAVDALAVKAVTDMAYRHYIARIGVVPQPMAADHMAKYGYEVVERRVDGPYDRIHYRKRLD